MQEKGRREYIKAEERNLCVREPKEEEPIYVCPDQNKVEAVVTMAVCPQRAVTEALRTRSFRWSDSNALPKKNGCVCWPHEAGLHACHRNRAQWNQAGVLPHSLQLGASLGLFFYPPSV